MAGTVAGAAFDPSEPEPPAGRPARRRRPLNRFPTPRPMPPEPASYARDDMYSMLSEIASSSWDSIYANASRPTRPSPRVLLPAGTATGAAGAATAATPAGAAGTATATPPRRPSSLPGQLDLRSVEPARGIDGHRWTWRSKPRSKPPGDPPDPRPR